jgi:peptidoglycan-associated lipoprotein
MIKKVLLSTSVLVLLFLTGCGQNSPDLSASNNNISDATALSGDTVSINDNAYGNESGGRGNSSSDGFQSLYFNFGDYSISSNMENAISRNVNVANNASGRRVKIEGNCDEFGTDEYNYALGLKRAKAVKDSMSSQGINTSKMVMVSFGESNPICTSSTDSCYGKNRRVDLRLVR